MGVGKSSLMSQYIKKEFPESPLPTIAIEFATKIIKIKEGGYVKAQIWDTAGQEKYKSITGAYFKGSKGALIVYDITQKNTFESLEKWVNDLKSAGDPKITIILIGNKSDLEETRQVSKEQGEEKAKNLKCAFFETSALSDINIDEIFEKFSSDSSEDKELGTNVKGEDVKLDKVKDKNKKKCC